MTVSILTNTVSTRTSSERPRSMPVWSRSERSLPVLTVDSRTFTDGHGRSGHTVNGRVVLSGINPCTIRIHSCSSIENIQTRMVPVFTRSLRRLHSTSRFIHGTNTVDFRPGRSRRKIKHVYFFCVHSRMVPDDARCLYSVYKVYDGHHRPPRIVTDWRSGMIRT